MNQSQGFLYFYFMRILVLLLAGLLLQASSFAQSAECAGGRYHAPIFSQVTTTSGIQYGANLQPSILNPNNIQDLFLDIYEPTGDTLQERPLIIWAFGGAFVFGSRTNPDIIELSDRFSQMGYVNAAIDYRLTGELVLNGNDTLANFAVVKAMHDMQAAIRFFYQSVQNGNPYGIDTNRIYIGGVSAGAITAVHAAYINDLAEWPAQVDTTGLGGIAGNSGNPGYSMTVAGVINLAGGIGDTNWIQADEPPIVSLHGDEDDVVPYGTDTIDLFNLGLVINGSASIQDHAQRIGLTASLYTFAGAGHVPFTQNNAQGPYMDTTVFEVKNFLYTLTCGTAPPLSVEQPGHELLSLFPNPAQQYLHLTTPSPGRVQLYDATGRLVWFGQLTAGTHTLTRGNWPRGWYILRWENGAQQTQRKILWQ